MYYTENYCSETYRKENQFCISIYLYFISPKKRSFIDIKLKIEKNFH